MCADAWCPPAGRGRMGAGAGCASVLHGGACGAPRHRYSANIQPARTSPPSPTTQTQVRMTYSACTSVARMLPPIACCPVAALALLCSACLPLSLPMLCCLLCYCRCSAALYCHSSRVPLDGVLCCCTAMCCVVLLRVSHASLLLSALGAPHWHDAQHTRHATHATRAKQNTTTRHHSTTYARTHMHTRTRTHELSTEPCRLRFH